MLNSYDEEEDDDDSKENEDDEGYKNTKYGHGLDGEDAEAENQYVVKDAKKSARLTPKKTLMGQLATLGRTTSTKKGVCLMIF
jgi:hypothetical protein